VSGPWVGIDPGSVSTGIVVRHGNRLLWHTVVHREADEDVVRGVGVGPEYIALVLSHVRIGWESHYSGVGGYIPSIAVEGVVRPNPHVNRKNGNAVIDPGPAIGTGMVLGAILALYPRAVIVPPGGNGAGMLATYPHALITPGEMRRGLNRPAGDTAAVRHCRSAWDVAGQAPIHYARRSAGRAS